MSVLAQFMIPAEELWLGQLVREVPGLWLEFDRLVPSDDGVLPYIWVTGGELETFERSLAASQYVADFQRLDQFDDAGLYRVEWEIGSGMLINAIVESNGMVLTGEVDEDLIQMLVRFADHDHLAQFYNYCTQHSIPVRMQRVYSLTDRSDRAREFGLTAEQRQALVLAARSGYFSTPREVTLGELADEIGISQQAMSQRIRGGTEKVMLEALGLAQSDRE